MDELIGSIAQNGFSIAVASFLLIRMDRRLEELTKAVIGLGSVIEKHSRQEQ
ncbi:MAG: YvrJ family protein [Synergistes sp.]|nr:YvrJ family protein [Synergistes sp.]MCR5335313.1 YvrJ family protein [Synergistes sp.]